jgi:hypothetical protein
VLIPHDLGEMQHRLVWEIFTFTLVYFPVLLTSPRRATSCAVMGGGRFSRVFNRRVRIF